MLLKPRLGSRMWRGIWPPSKPAIDTPERALAPFWPRPAVLPRPEPIPRPTRTRPCRAPLLSRSWLSFMVLHSLSLLSRSPSIPKGHCWSGGLVDPEEVLDLADLSHHFGCRLDLHGSVELVEAQPNERRPLGLVAAGRRSGLRNLDLRHAFASVTASACASASAGLAPPRPSRSATFFPRRCATERGLVCSLSASKVARIML